MENTTQNPEEIVATNPADNTTNPFVLKYDLKQKKYYKVDLALNAAFEVTKEKYHELKEILSNKENENNIQ